jgi:hypothetical protein
MSDDAAIENYVAANPVPHDYTGEERRTLRGIGMTRSSNWKRTDGRHLVNDPLYQRDKERRLVEKPSVLILYK